MAGANFGSSSDGDDELLSGINVTPLVDVVLVLLIIFLMTAPVIYQSAIQVQLPRTVTADPQDAKNPTPFQFTVTREGNVLWKDKAVEWSSLGEQLRKALGQTAEATAVIQADQAAQHGAVVRLMDTLRQAGIFKFALSVQPASTPQ